MHIHVWLYAPAPTPSWSAFGPTRTLALAHDSCARMRQVIAITDEGEGQDLEDELKFVKFSCLAWTHDNKGFFYNRYPPQETSDLGTEVEINLNQSLWYHRVRTERLPSRRKRVLSRPFSYSLAILADGSSSVSGGYDTHAINRIFLADDSKVCFRFLCCPAGTYRSSAAVLETIQALADCSGNDVSSLDYPRLREMRIWHKSL